MLREILPEGRHALGGDGLGRHALKEDDVEHLVGTLHDIRVHFVRQKIVLDVVPAQHPGADGLQAGLPGAVGGAREAADVAVNSAVIV